MSDYNTGNPVPSTDPRDLDDNATNFDKLLMQSVATVPDRLGVPRRTWWQFEQQAAALLDNPTFDTVTMTGPLNNAPIQTIASAATVDLAASTANTVSVTGTVTVTALGNMPVGTRRRIIFAGILVLTHNASAIVIPGTASITTATGDVADVESIGVSQWRVVNYVRASGQPTRTVSVALGGTGATDASGARTNLGVLAQTDKPSWTSYTPTITPLSGTFTSASATARYLVLFGICYLQIALTVVTKGTGAFPTLSLPASFPALAGSADHLLPCRASTGSLVMGQAKINAALTGVQITRYDSNELTADGTTIVVQGFYPIA